MPARLIITADDLGANPPRSHGIFLAAEHGLVTNAGLLPNGSDSANAGKRARERKVPTGLHLNLTSNEPISPPETVSSLLMPNGEFCELREFERRLRNDALDPAHLEREIRAQVEWCLDVHGQPTHVSSADHIHCYPLLTNALIPIMGRYGIMHVRLPSEPLPPFGYEVSPQELEAAGAIAKRAEDARALFASEGITSTDSFRGLTLVGRMSAKNLRHMLSRFPTEGSVELMVHPGSPTPIGTPFDTDPQRQTELQTVLDANVPPLLTKAKITRCSYADL